VVLRDRPEHPALLGPPWRRHAVEEHQVYLPIDPVHIHGIEAVLKSSVLVLESTDRILVELFLVYVALLNNGLKGG
jgi:hypothetical protein